LEKTGFAQPLEEKDLQSGESSTILKLVHHLMFRASERFTQHLEDKGMHPDVKYMPDAAFFKNVTLILCDMFGY
jgi:hypothetical protein